MVNRGRIWIPAGDEVHLYGHEYCVRVLVLPIGAEEPYALDLTPRVCRRLARSLDIAAELAEHKERK
jgi:hypothetical protein